MRLMLFSFYQVDLFIYLNIWMCLFVGINVGELQRVFIFTTDNY
jgi:hypothetical protein